MFSKLQNPKLINKPSGNVGIVKVPSYFTIIDLFQLISTNCFTHVHSSRWKRAAIIMSGLTIIKWAHSNI